MNKKKKYLKKFIQTILFNGGANFLICKEIRNTVPETFYFPIFLCVHPALTVYSPCLNLCSLVRSHSSFTKCSLCFQKAFTLHSPFVQHSLIIIISTASFIFIWYSKVKGSVFESYNKMRKERMCKGRKKLTFHIRVFILIRISHLVEFNVNIYNDITTRIILYFTFHLHLRSVCTMRLLTVNRS